MMLTSRRWRSPIALVTILGFSTLAAVPSSMASTPLFTEPSSQLYGQQPLSLPSGSIIPVTYDRAEKIVVTPEDTMRLSLTVVEDVTASDGTIIIPSGSTIQGQLEPAGVGTQFVASEVILPNRRRATINAVSEVITKTETINQGVNGTSVLTGAAVGAGAATVLSVITGDRRVGTGEVLGGAGLGALAGIFLGRNRATVIVIDPRTDLDLRLNTDFVPLQSRL